MKAFFKPLFLFFLAFSILVAGCKKDNESNNPNNTNTGGNNTGGNNNQTNTGVFSAKIDAKDFVAKGIYIGCQVQKYDGFYGLSVVGTNPASTNRPVILGVSIIMEDFSTLKEGDKFEGTSPTSIGIASGTYLVDSEDENEEINATTSRNGRVTVIIGTIDRDKKQISGTFNFVAEDEEKGISYDVTSGLFQNVTYKEKE